MLVLHVLRAVGLVAILPAADRTPELLDAGVADQVPEQVAAAVEAAQAVRAEAAVLAVVRVDVRLPAGPRREPLATNAAAAQHRLKVTHNTLALASCQTRERRSEHSLLRRLQRPINRMANLLATATEHCPFLALSDIGLFTSAKTYVPFNLGTGYNRTTRPGNDYLVSRDQIDACNIHSRLPSKCFVSIR